MNIKDFITRFESACNPMGLGNDAEKCNLFGSYLRGRACRCWQLRSIKEHFMIRYRGKTETTTFCHQLPKLVQDKTESVSDFAERCIMEMQEFVDAMPLPADRFFSAGYLALPAGERTQARNAER
jgi:hypothetical protein